VHNYSRLDELLNDFGPASDLDLRGVELSAEVLGRILERFRREGRHDFGDVRFDQAWFSGRAGFELVWFGDVASFDGAWFSGPVSFSGVTSEGSLSLYGARFESDDERFSLSGERLVRDRALFARAANINVVVERVTIDAARFDQGFTLRVGWGDVSANAVHFGATSTIVGWPGARKGRSARLRGMAGSDVSNLVLADMDLRQCSFVGAYRLDQLRIDGQALFAVPPGRWRHTRRRVLADENAWRGWDDTDGGDPSPARVSALYRSLRKSFEDNKNEAGAGDFYYGEMEMRRHSTETSRAEKTILWFYWLLSGYGQRAVRAVAALVVLVVTVAALLIVWGQPFEPAARIAVGAVVFRDDQTELTAAGEWTVLTARFLGPVLLALAVLAVRARVKR